MDKPNSLLYAFYRSVATMAWFISQLILLLIAGYVFIYLLYTRKGYFMYFEPYCTNFVLRKWLFAKTSAVAK